LSPEGDPRAGITSTVPVEAVFAAGLVPVDLNNLFVADPDRSTLIEMAHAEGFPQGSCAWIKGIYGAVRRERIRRVIGVVRGDCSATAVLLEALELAGVTVLPFEYPASRDRDSMLAAIDALCSSLGTGVDEAAPWLERLRPARKLLLELDGLCWREGKVSGLEDHTWLVSSSDFGSDPAAFESRLADFLEVAGQREPLDARPLPYSREVRLAYIGVPPTTTDIFPRAEATGARFVFCEVQRQFSMPSAVMASATPGELAETYLQYTYPYSVSGRALDINVECARRDVDGIVHYVQSFCFRNLEDAVFSRLLDRPVLTLECDCPGELSAQARSRLDNFIQVLGENIQ
jgi:benzoyl-CoA reductase/2-hydroxyglutaryl-CoA dehydratase subunit BcrC/BadD/HgdB